MLQAKLPAAKPKGEPLPEGLLWLLLTGEVSCPAQLQRGRPVSQLCVSKGSWKRLGAWQLQAVSCWSDWELLWETDLSWKPTLVAALTKYTVLWCPPREQAASITERLPA